MGAFLWPFVCEFFQYGAEGIEPLVSEDKVMFGIHGHAKSVLTLAKIRKHFRRSDTRAVAREVGGTELTSGFPRYYSFVPAYDVRDL